MAKKRPNRRKRSHARHRGRRLTTALLAFLLVGLGVAAWLIWPFWQLVGQFGSVPEKQPSRLYGRPAELRVGSPATAEGLAAELKDLGYRQSPNDSPRIPGSFHSGAERVEIFRRFFPTPGGEEGGDRLRVELRGGAISSLRLAGNERSLSTARIAVPLIASYYGPDLKERRPVSLDNVPEDLILAVLAAEDSRFLEHKGVSLTGILRAAWVNLWAGGVRQGGSTLTQQLVKNIYLTHERRLVRKVREALLAVMLEIRFEKRDILQAYLNEIYWGRSGNVHLMGVGAAAWAYFGKEPAQLSLGESALLAGMIQSPAHLSPLADLGAAKTRRDVVLGRLVQLKWATEERAKQASAEPVVLAPGPRMARRAPYFADWIEGQVARRFGIASLRDAGYQLHSTLSLPDQLAAEEAVSWGLESLEEGWEKGRGSGSPLQAALVSLSPADGGILAWVGGRSYALSQYDRVSLARRQAGSVFKPIVYAAAFEQRVATPATLLEDGPYTVRLAGRSWSPQNSDGKYRGMVTVRQALQESLNVPTARLAQEVGLERVVQMARRLGIQGPLDPFPALALGAMEVSPLEMVVVYGTLAGGGRRPGAHGLVAIFDRTGEAVRGPGPEAPTQVLDPDVAYQVTVVLQGVLDHGTGRGARKQGLNDPLAGKTGTTNSRRDSWFAGYSPRRATMVWVGYDDNQKTRLSGARAALPIWARFSYGVRPPGGFRDFERPEGTLIVRIDPITGGLATDRCPEVVAEVFLADDPPRDLCPDHSGWRSRALDQPEGVEPEGKRHPFRRWLDMLKSDREKEPS